MTELTSEQVAALRKELLIDYEWLLNRMKELQSYPEHKNNYELVAVEEYNKAREVELVNLALRRYGFHD